MIDRAASSGAGEEHVFLALGAYAPLLYAQTNHVGGVLETSDSGTSWSDLTGPLSATSVNTLLPYGSTLLAGTEHGVEQYASGRWSAARFPNVRVNKLFLSADRSAMFATTYGRGTLESILVPAVQGGHGPARPKNQIPPSMSGVPVVGRTLTSTTGRWSGSPRPRFHLQWQRCGRRCVNIAGATGRSYTVRGADAGDTIRVTVRASNRLGSRTIASPRIPVHARPIGVGQV